MAVIFDTETSYSILEKALKGELKSLGRRLCLASIAIGKNYSTDVYRTSQEKLAKDLGIEYRPIDLKTGISFDKFKSKIVSLNNDSSVTGILINKPFTTGWNEKEVFSLLAKNKDIEGVHPANLGKLFISCNSNAGNASKCFKDILMPPTVWSILHVLGQSKVEVYAKRVTIVGFSSIIGKPLALILADSLATVTIAQIGTYENGDLPSCVKNADILISAVGKPDLIKGEWIKDGSVVIDVGTGKKDGHSSGDVEFGKAKQKAGFITPVPGGVGKLTPLFLYRNLVIAAKFKS